MNEANIQQQINEINQKLDLVLNHVNEQRLKSQSVEDLVSDVSIVVKDVYDTAVEELTDQQVVIDPDELKLLGIKFLKNIKNFNMMFNMFESITDLAKDLNPIVNEVMIDSINKLSEFEKKGYLDFIKEASKIVQNIMDNFSTEDVRLLSDNIVTIMETVKCISQPEILKTVDNTINVYKNIDFENIPELSLWKAFKEIRSPEMKKGLGFIITFLKNIATNDVIKITNNKIQNYDTKNNSRY